MSSDEPRWMPLLGTKLAIRLTALDDAQCVSNHGQTLAQLAIRGGVSPSEAVALIEHRQCTTLAHADALARLMLHNRQR